MLHATAAGGRVFMSGDVVAVWCLLNCTTQPSIPSGTAVCLCVCR